MLGVTQTGDETDEVLDGGLANAGAVVRRGDVVRRPAPRNAAGLHAWLRAARRSGFDGLPEPLRLTGDGREELTFVAGDVALPPFPRWAMTADALRSVGELLARLHAVSDTVPVDGSAPWSREMADPEVGTAPNGGTGPEVGTAQGSGIVLCHNDVCPENVVFRAGRAAALIDFDLAAPGRPLWDLAMTARYWVPMLDPRSAAFSYPDPVDAPARLRLLSDGYGLAREARAELPTVIEQATAVCREFVERRVADADPPFLRTFTERGGWSRWDRLQTWLTDHRETFVNALTQA
ncbi:phosphotransferase [Streptomyces sp. CA-111067]|uniref:phosphotransferase n=1 Tax=Streptomyces sp. CA-111067 TaxID=3240046 RepID=UPI003D9809B9